MAKKTIRWTEKDRLKLNLSLLIGISSGIISATLVSSIYNIILYPNMTNYTIYVINWIVAGGVLIFAIVKIWKYEKLIK